jgi:hypothetical protein
MSRYWRLAKECGHSDWRVPASSVLLWPTALASEAPTARIAAALLGLLGELREGMRVGAGGGV